MRAFHKLSQGLREERERTAASKDKNPSELQATSGGTAGSAPLPDSLSPAQILYMKKLKQHHRLVLFLQVFLLIFIIAAWEFCSNTRSSVTPLSSAVRPGCSKAPLLSIRKATCSDTSASLWRKPLPAFFWWFFSPSWSPLCYGGTRLQRDTGAVFCHPEQSSKIRHGSHFYRMAGKIT